MYRWVESDANFTAKIAHGSVNNRGGDKQPTTWKRIVWRRTRVSYKTITIACADTRPTKWKRSIFSFEDTRFTYFSLEYIYCRFYFKFFFFSLLIFIARSFCFCCLLIQLINRFVFIFICLPRAFVSFVWHHGSWVYSHGRCIKCRCRWRKSAHTKEQWESHKITCI